MIDLWTEASLDHEQLARTAALARAEAEFAGVFPFLAAARTEGEYTHRRALAEDRLVSIALRHGVDPDEILKLADRRWELLKEALTEGENPLGWIPDGGGYGSGPEKPDEHSEGPDFSHSYAEVPEGAQGGPDPRVVVPEVTRPGPVQEATGKHRKRGKHEKTADSSTMAPGAEMPPGQAPMAAAPPPLPAGVPGTTPAASGQVTGAADPVRRQVMAVTASIQATNPSVSAEHAERLARRVVGQYLRPATADLDSSVIDNDPGGTGPGDGSGKGGHGMSGAEEFMLARGLTKVLPAVAETLIA